MNKTSFFTLIVLALTFSELIICLRPFNNNYFLIKSPTDNTPPSDFELPDWQFYKINNYLNAEGSKKIVEFCVNVNNREKINQNQTEYNEYYFLVKVSGVKIIKGMDDNFYYPYLSVISFEPIRKLTILGLLITFFMSLLFFLVYILRNKKEVKKDG